MFFNCISLTAIYAKRNTYFEESNRQKWCRMESDPCAMNNKSLSFLAWLACMRIWSRKFDRTNSARTSLWRTKIPKCCRRIPNNLFIRLFQFGILVSFFRVHWSCVSDAEEFFSVKLIFTSLASLRLCSAIGMNEEVIFKKRKKWPPAKKKRKTKKKHLHFT